MSWRVLPIYIYKKFVSNFILMKTDELRQIRLGWFGQVVRSETDKATQKARRLNTAGDDKR